MNITFRGQRVYRPVDVGMVAAQGGGTIVTGDMQDDMSFYEVLIMSVLPSTQLKMLAFDSLIHSY